jgi:hypothetical protein
MIGVSVAASRILTWGPAGSGRDLRSCRDLRVALDVADVLGRAMGEGRQAVERLLEAVVQPAPAAGYQHEPRQDRA